MQQQTYPVRADDELADDSAVTTLARHSIDGAVNGDDMLDMLAAALPAANCVGVLTGKILWVEWVDWGDGEKTGGDRPLLLVTVTEAGAVEIHECILDKGECAAGKAAVQGRCHRRLLVDDGAIPALVRAHVLAARWAEEQGGVRHLGGGEGECDPYWDSFLVDAR